MTYHISHIRLLYNSYSYIHIYIYIYIHISLSLYIYIYMASGAAVESTQLASGDMLLLRVSLVVVVCVLSIV